MRFLKLCMLGLMIFTGTSLFAQKDLDFSDFDKDNDWWIEKHEFLQKFTDVYSEDWDNTNDTGLDDEDFYLSTFRLIDRDNDDFLNEEEWVFGYDHFFGDYLDSDFAVIDYDEDNSITYQEYFDALYDSDYFLNWDVDRDTFLNEYELAEAVFRSWDRNNNRLLGRGEFNSMDEYFLDL